MKTPEGIVKEAVTDYLKRKGYFYRRMNSGIVKVRGGVLHLCPEGTADILVCTPRHTVWIELKAPKGTTAKARQVAQAAFASEVEGLGHKYLRCESVDDVQRFLTALDA